MHKVVETWAGSMLDYERAVCVLAHDLDWNEPALVHQFKEGLKEEILDQIAHAEKNPFIPRINQSLSLEWIKGHLETQNTVQE